MGNINTPGFKDFVQKISPEIPPSPVRRPKHRISPPPNRAAETLDEGYEISPTHVPLVALPFVLFTYAMMVLRNFIYHNKIISITQLIIQVLQT